MTEWRTVPAEPTEAMVKAACFAGFGRVEGFPEQFLAEYKAALAAARKERDEAVADRAEFMRAADRLYHDASEQQHTLGSKGWHRTDAIRWSAAGARWEQYQNLAASLLDMADVMQAKNPSKLEARGPYAEVVEKNAALQRAIDEAIIFVEGHLTDENRRKLLAATLRPHATPSQPERAKEEPAIQRWSRIAAWAKDNGLLGTDGEPRKILGTLPVTEDGAIVGDGAGIYWWNRWLKAAFMQITDWQSPVKNTYSTREAAEAAAKGGSDGQ